MAATSQDPTLFHDYEGFVEKFKPKKTTDDCYTPDLVMEAVNRYVSDRWGIDSASFVRPFYPGGDYERFEYPTGCVVVDNPPFSMLSKIERFYIDSGIKFFLFAPALTLFSGAQWEDLDHIACGANITYECGAKVSTSFVTNLEPGVVLECDPGLLKAVNEASNKAAKNRNERKHRQKYSYPIEVLTAARAQWLAGHGERLVIRKGECKRIAALDAQRKKGRSIFGGGMLLSERAAAERAAAERAADIVWDLSEAERMAVASMGR